MYTCTVILNVILVISLGVSIVSSQGGVDTFRGAVVEYGARYNSTSSKETVLKNLNNYVNIANELKRKYSDLKIIVFPEGGLASNKWLRRNGLDIYGELYPEKNSSKFYCEDSYNTSEVLKTLACIGKNQNVYVVVNLVEKKVIHNVDFLYSTNIVLSPQGAIVAKYHKYNIYGFEKRYFDQLNETEFEYFDTDFGVRFGLFISSDIFFKTPALDLVNGNYNISHFAYSTAWQNELPFATAVQEQSSWSYGTNKVLLASGINSPLEGYSGSGIYFGKLGNDNTIDKRSVQNQIDGDFAIVSYIPKSLVNLTQFSSRSEIYHFYNKSNPDKTPLKVTKDNLEVYTTDVIDDSQNIEWVPESRNLTIFTEKEINKTVCDRDLCCKFVFKIKRSYCLDVMMPSTNEIVGEEFGQYDYRLAVFNGVRNFDDKTITAGIQVCSIISCLDSNEGSCGKKTVDVTPYSIKQGDYKYRHCYTDFDNVIISAELSTNNSFVSSNILQSSQHYLFSLNSDKAAYDYIKFGKIADPSLYTISIDSETVNTTKTYVFKSTNTIRDPASINLYNRLFNWDGQPVTENKPKSSGSNFYLSTYLLLLSLLILFIRK